MNRRNLFLASCVVALSLALMTGALGQTTIYVNGAVSSSGDGLTPATAKKTVAEGLAAAQQQRIADLELRLSALEERMAGATGQRGVPAAGH